MRLWHQELISKLPSKKDYKGCTNQLGGQHTEIRMILGSIKKHGKVNHSTVNYINNHALDRLYAYGLLVCDEMLRRGFNVNPDIIAEYSTTKALSIYLHAKHNNSIIFPEHNENYLLECRSNLKNKGITI
jgi:uncharacterized protein (TIGR02328 family)